MKSSSLGPLIALSALAVAPSVAMASEPTTPVATSSTATTPDPAPLLTTPAASTPGSTPDVPVDPSTPVATNPDAAAVTTPADTSPQATDPAMSDVTGGIKGESKRRAARRKARETQADRDPAPTGQATDNTLIPPSSLTVTSVPNFFIEDFDIPPFLLPIYQAAGSEYGIRWEVLAAINYVETDFGKNLNVSSAGALGWMQFMPATWEQYGVDANDDGEKDPFNPADAIFAAARYLKAAGGDVDLRQGIYSYNHADWYVNQVLEKARTIAAYPDSLISSLTALTQGLFPVTGADSTIDYAGKVDATQAAEKVKVDTNAADPVGSKKGRSSIEISAKDGASVVAVQDGVVEKVGESERLGKFVRVRDSYGNRYTYGHLGEIQDKVPVPKPVKATAGPAEGETTTADAPAATTPTDIAPTTPATATDPAAATTPAASLDPATTPTTPVADSPVVTTPDAAPATASRSRLTAKTTPKTTSSSETTTTPAAETPRRIRYRARDAVQSGAAVAQPSTAKTTRFFAHPTRLNSYSDGGAEQLNPTAVAALDTPATAAPTGELAKYFSLDYGLKAKDVTLEKLKAGQAVIAGTILGKTQVSLDGSGTSKVTFEIRPAGKKAPRIDPRPILDGWRLSDRTDFYGAQAKKAVVGDPADTADATVGQVLLMSKAELQDRVLADKRITIYECGQRDIKAGIIDRRILALLEVMAVKGMTPNVTALECGHGLMTASGNVSEHSTGTAVDIGAVYGTTISPATQGEGSVTDRAVREILKLQGNMKPHQIITLMTYAGQDNTLGLPDHYNHIHVGYRPTTGTDGKQLEQLLQPGQWSALVDQLSSIKVPDVSASPSDYSVTVKKTTP